MRYKVKVAPEAEFESVARAAADYTKVYVVSEGRRMLSIGDLSEDAITHLQSLGAKVLPDLQYDADRSAA